MAPTNNDLDVIFGRRSIRSFQEAEIEEGTIQSLLKSAMAAPSAVAKDPWHFIVVKNKDTLKKISFGLPNGKMLANAPLGIIVCGNIAEAHDNQLSYMLQDCSAAIENLLIAAYIKNLGACWLGVHPRDGRIQHIRKIFDLPEEIIPVACIAIGYPKEHKQARTRFHSQKVHYETW